MNPIYQLGWFSSGRDKAARDLLVTTFNSIQQGDIDADLAFVFCNREPGESKESNLFIKLVEGYNIPLVCFSYREYRKAKGERNPSPAEPMPQWRLDYDREVMQRLEGFKPDLSVLAGFMMITGPELCQKYDMINLHPAAPGGPAGTWQEVIWQLIDGQARQTGVMMHLVTPELDKGPAVAYCTFSIRGEPFDKYWDEIKGHSAEEIREKESTKNPLFKLIRQHGLAREFPLVIDTLKAFGEQEFQIINHQVLDPEGKHITGYNLTAEIDKRLEGINLSAED